MFILSSATHLVMSSGHTLPKSTPTRYRKPGVSDVFSLEAVYLAWLLKDAPGAEYMKQARESGLAVGFVSVTERKNVVDFLGGVVADYERIIPLGSESTTPPGSPPQSSATATHTATAKSAQKSTSFTDTSASPTKRRYVPDAQDVEAVKKIKRDEVELRDRNTVLRGGGKSGGSVSTPATPAPGSCKLQVRKSKNNYPIIMISSSPTALITMHNVKRFLQESTFEPSQTARERATAEGNPRPEDLIPIYRKRTTIDSSGKEVMSQARYFVVDSVEALGKFGADAWERVVCVMTTGQAWQFRPYKWSEPRTLFHHVKGIYVTWSNDPPNHKIKDWNVTELKIDPHRRHVDKSVVAHFWKTLDTWIMANKPGLMTG
ncbi:RNA polymerase II-associated protein [Infundibulicybe gibba]|nr:RNA polymerase II-associated protein [Infundibulicybe gibba]